MANKYEARIFPCLYGGYALAIGADVTTDWYEPDKTAYIMYSYDVLDREFTGGEMAKFHNVGVYNIPTWCVDRVSDEKAVEYILASGDIEYEIKRNGISTYKVKCDDHWYMIVKTIDKLISVEEVLP